MLLRRNLRPIPQLETKPTFYHRLDHRNLSACLQGQRLPNCRSWYVKFVFLQDFKWRTCPNSCPHEKLCFGCHFVRIYETHADLSIEFGQECYCGVVLGNGTTPLASTSCNMPCKGDSTETCGGRNALNIYVATDLESSQPCQNGGTTTSSSSVVSSTTSTIISYTSSTVVTTSSSSSAGTSSTSSTLSSSSSIVTSSSVSTASSTSSSLSSSSSCKSQCPTGGNNPQEFV